MRLRLNTTLRAALIAAITAVGFTLTQAQALVSSPTAANAAGWFTHDLTENTWIYSDNYMGAQETAVSSSFSFDDGTGSAIVFGKSDGTRAMYTFAATIDFSKLTVSSDTYLLKADNVTGIGMLKNNRNLTETWQSSNVKYVDTSYSLPTEGIYTIVHTTGDDGAWVAVYNQAGTEVAKGRTGDKGLKGSGKPTNFLIDDSLKGAILTFGVWQTGNNSLSADNMQLAAKAMADFPLVPPTEFTWAATGESAAWDTTSTVWNTSDKTGTNYVSAVTSTAIFGTGEVAKNVTVSGDIKAGTVNVQDDYKFTVGSGSSLTIDTLTVAVDKTATVAGEGSVTLNSLSGALAIQAGSTVDMFGIVTLDGSHTLQVSGEGTLGVTTLKVAGGTHDINSCLKVTGGGNGEGTDKNNLGLHFSAANSTLNINAGTTTVTGAVYSNQNAATLNIGTGDKEATLVARRIELSDGGSSALNIGAKGKVVITSTNDTNGSTGAYKTTGLLLSEWVGGTTATIEGKLYAQNVSMYTGDAGMTLNINKGGVVAVKGIATNFADAKHTSSSTINLAEGGKIVLGASGMADCTIAPWTINLNGGEIGMTADTTLGRDMTVTGPVTFNTAKYTWSGEGAGLELKEGTEGGTMTVTGTISGSGAITKKGAGTLVIDTLNVTAGSLAVMEGDASINYISKTGEGEYAMNSTGTTSLVSGIDLQGGSLTMSGKYDISDVYVDGEYFYDGGMYDGNGFVVMEGDALVVDIAEGATLDAAGATFTWNSGVVTVDNTTGKAAVSGTNYGTFYIFTRSETVATAKRMEFDHGPLSSIYVEEGGTLEVDENINASLVDALSTGTVNIQDTKTVTAATDARHFSLAGEGTYDLGSATTLGSVALTDDWMGTVKISNNGDAANLNLANLGRDGSTVELNGVTGWLSNDGVHIDAAVKLSGNGLTINNGSSNKTIEFAGGVKGGGDLVYTMANGADKQTYIFSGDISDWSGSYMASGEGKTSTLKFYDDATEVNAAIVREEGTLNMEVGDGTHAFDTVFYNEVSASAITVKENASATFNDLHITSAIQNSGTVKFLYDIEVSDFQETEGQEGYYDLNNQFTTNGNGYAGTSDSYLTIVNGGTVVADGITVTQDGTEYTMNNSGLALKGDGGVSSYDTYFVNTNDPVKVSDIDNSGHDTVAVKVTYGTLNVDQSTQLAITVTDEGTITGDAADAKQVDIAASATAYYTGEVVDSGVKFTKGPLIGAVQIDNYGETTQKYSIASKDLTVAALKLEMTGTKDVTVSNQVVVDELVNTTGKVLTLDNTDALMLTSMDITGSTMELSYVNDQSQVAEGTVAIIEMLQGGSATLKADLTLFGGSTLDVDGGGSKALTLGSTLTVDYASGLINLDADTIAALNGLGVGETLNLIVAADKTTLEYSGSYDGMWYDEMFNRVDGLQGDYTVYAQGNAFGLTKFNNIPEPATGTLSLLALSALAVRRRRK